MCCHVLVQLFSVLHKRTLMRRCLPKKILLVQRVQLVQQSSTGPKKINWPKKKFNWSKTYLEYLLAFMAHELVFFAVCPQMNIERV